jgi:hypothetical protein
LLTTKIAFLKSLFVLLPLGIDKLIYPLCSGTENNIRSNVRIVITKDLCSTELP